MFFSRLVHIDKICSRVQIKNFNSLLNKINPTFFVARLSSYLQKLQDMRRKNRGWWMTVLHSSVCIMYHTSIYCQRVQM